MSMICSEFRKQIPDYLSRRLSLDQLDAFLAHEEECEECREELEVQFIFDSGLKQLSAQAPEELDFPKAFHGRLAHTKKTMARMKRFRLLTYVAGTLAFWAVFFSLILQIRIWIMG